jgi:Flp pilus assembly protein TadG
MPVPGTCMGSLKGLQLDRRGTAAVEFAIIASVLTVILFGIYDLSSAALRRMQLAAAVRAGGEYALHFPSDTTGIQNAVTNAVSGNWGSSVTTTISCSCTTSSNWQCNGTVPPTCASPYYISVSASVPVNTLTYRFLGSNANVSASYVAQFK